MDFPGELIFRRENIGGEIHVNVDMTVVDPRGVLAAGNQIPTEFGFEGIYPNPFNSTTSITFSLSVRDRIRLSLFDIGGREVSVLVDEEVEAGTHRFEYQAASLPTGLYFLRLEGSVGSVCRKVVLVR